jgi:selenocysteine lyase/cysteine desulfurase
VSIRRRDFLSAFAVSQPWLAWQGEPGWIDDLEALRGRIGLDQRELDWGVFRREFDLDPQIAFLNTGSIGCTPRIIVDQMHQADLVMERNPFHHVWEDGLAGGLELVRQRVADFFAVTKAEIALTENTTCGLHAIGSGIRWQAGDEVILTNHEHLSCMAVWKYLQKRHDLKLNYVEVPVPNYSPGEFLSRLEARLTPRTKAICLSHVDSISGVELPIKEASKLTRPRNLLLICDAAQSLGMIPVDIRELGVDALAGSGHKWLLGSKGTGLIFVDRRVQDRIQPQLVDWSYAALTPSTGTRNITHLLSWALVIAIQEMLTPQRIADRITRLSTDLTAVLLKQPGLSPLIHGREQPTTGLISFHLEKTKNSLEIAKRLAADHRVIVKPLPPTYELDSSAEHPSVEYHALRFSTHVYNDQQEITRAADALQAVLSN